MHICNPIVGLAQAPEDRSPEAAGVKCLQKALIPDASTLRLTSFDFRKSSKMRL